MIYWQGINIGDWRFRDEIANIKSTILFQSEHAQWHVTLNPQYQLPPPPRQIHQILLLSISHLVWYVKFYNNN